MTALESPISCETALARILEGARPLDSEQVPLEEGEGRAVSRAVRARQSLPAWDNSAKDGYAVARDDLQALRSGAGGGEKDGLSLFVAAESSAGQAPDQRLERGTVARIMTGAPLPAGADAVIPVEDGVSPSGRGRFAAIGERVTLYAPPAAGANVRRAGADVSEGDVIVEEGETLTAHRLALLAALGEPGVDVVRRPRIAIIPTGDELVEPGHQAGPGKLYSSNGPGLTALAREAGGLPRLFGVVPDDSLEIHAAVFEAMEAHEVVVTSGGVSAGAHDHVRGVLEEAGGGLVFWKVKMRPGEPLVFARTSDLPGTGRVPTRYLFGLPGNPTSALVTFLEFVRPLIRSLAGFADVFLPTVRATLREPLRVEEGRLSFIRVRLSRTNDGQFMAAPAGAQGSGLLRPLAEADGLLIAGPQPELAAGTSAIVQLLRCFRGPTVPFGL
jgi:molybdopterin molybdotransferase